MATGFKVTRPCNTLFKCNGDQRTKAIMYSWKMSRKCHLPTRIEERESGVKTIGVRQRNGDIGAALTSVCVVDLADSSHSSTKNKSLIPHDDRYCMVCVYDVVLNAGRLSLPIAQTWGQVAADMIETARRYRVPTGTGYSRTSLSMTRLPSRKLMVNSSSPT